LPNPYTGVLANFGARPLNGQPPLVFEDGRQHRDFVHVGDVAQAFPLAIDTPDAAGQIFNIGSANVYTTRPPPGPAPGNSVAGPRRLDQAIDRSPRLARTTSCDCYRTGKPDSIICSDNSDQRMIPDRRADHVESA
jgi:hypothetical protein